MVITNQSGIARGYFTVDDMHKLHEHINSELRKYEAYIDAFYYCPHHPNFTGKCTCRKPDTGLIKQAINDFDIDVTKSIMFGDRTSDIQVGNKCGIKSFMIDDYLAEFLQSGKINL